jgi:hypothetical protein
MIYIKVFCEVEEYRIQNIAAGVTSYLVNHKCKDLGYFKKVYYLYTNTI